MQTSVWKTTEVSRQASAPVVGSGVRPQSRYQYSSFSRQGTNPVILRDDRPHAPSRTVSRSLRGQVYFSSAVAHQDQFDLLPSCLISLSGLLPFVCFSIFSLEVLG